MRRSVRMWLAFLIAFAAAPSLARSQEAAADSSQSHGPGARRSIPVLVSVIGGPGVETPTPYVFEKDGETYQTQKRPMVFELEISKTIAASSGTRTFFEYYVAAQPAVSVGGNVHYTFLPCQSADCLRRGVVIQEQRYTAVGVGVTPFGLRMTTTLPLHSRFSLGLGIGGVRLTRAVPYDEARKFNFQLTARPAIGIPIRNHGTFWAGYELFHMSNANTAPINPGINAGLLMFGFQPDR